MRINLSNKQILEHLEMIDSHLHMPYREFAMPSSVERMTIDELARLMVQHVGLYEYEPVIEYDRLENGTAGYVEMNNNLDKKIRITLSDDLTIAMEAKYAALAHEICHKLLFTHDCYFPYMGDYNESLTDIATIYVGFGKLTLNGCLVIDPSHRRETGYLDIEQYAMAYRMVCHVNNVPKVDYEAGLDAEALPVMRSNGRIDALESQLAELPELLRQYRINKYEEDATKMREVVMMEAALKQIKKELAARQKTDIESLGVVDTKKGEIINPYRVMLMTLGTRDEVIDMSTEECQSVYKWMRRLMQEDHIMKATLTITCPVCGFSKKNAFAEYKKSLIRCPKCNHVFYWDSSASFENEQKEKDQSEKKNNASFFNIFKWIRS